MKKDYPECSGNPASCPENEGYGCCKPNPVAGHIQDLNSSPEHHQKMAEIDCKEAFEAWYKPIGSGDAVGFRLKIKEIAGVAWNAAWKSKHGLILPIGSNSLKNDQTVKNVTERECVEPILQEAWRFFNAEIDDVPLLRQYMRTQIEGGES